VIALEVAMHRALIIATILLMIPAFASPNGGAAACAATSYA
jgi:hypothetical protein